MEFERPIYDMAHVVWSGDPASLGALFKLLGINHGDAHCALP